ncbi:16S rRNA (cytidine(1402)-2'-O)-methyltransferase [Glaciecola siphonariae]|uniref:Ribosomal RNA small subunit methyltransferase I n=1 Tax=Glaciecola siphonariae TaxID=521012 RepID=A0ABV9M0L7_9ALTE
MSLPGCLYIVPTPIGNLSDISARALEVLSKVDLIAAEDTRHSSRLLGHYQIATRTISMHTHNEQQRTGLLINKLNEGMSIALISDAGTPLISDPGYSLVNSCRNEGLQVIALPGPCALTTALSASGLPTDTFTFFGFLPVKQQAKAEKLLAAAGMGHTAVFYEAPRRIADTLKVCKANLSEHTEYVLAKELTKSFETFVAGSVDDLLDYLAKDPAHAKGEFVLLLYCKSQQIEGIPEGASALLSDLLPLMPPKQAAAVVAKHYDVNKKQVYEMSLSLKNS